MCSVAQHLNSEKFVLEKLISPCLTSWLGPSGGPKTRRHRSARSDPKMTKAEEGDRSLCHTFQGRKNIYLEKIFLRALPTTWRDPDLGRPQRPSTP